tara:strand:+ start:6667 stop:6837 length:171 start_codon:yes stop_codon:yes gene_type:complete
MKKFFLLFLLVACSTKTLNNESSNVDLKFNMDFSYSDYKNFLEKYNSVAPYPDISK